MKKLAFDSTGMKVSYTVEALLAEAVSKERSAFAQGEGPRRVYSQKLRELADYLGVSHPYMPRKIKSGSWSVSDLDKLAVYFGKNPRYFVPGPGEWGLAEAASKGETSEKVTPEKGEASNADTRSTLEVYFREPGQKTE